MPTLNCRQMSMIVCMTTTVVWSVVQVLWLSVVMIPLYALNQQLVYASFKALDVGGSISIHAFGAYYGLAASLVLSRCVGSGNCKRGFCMRTALQAMRPCS